MKENERLNILFPDWQGYGRSQAAHTGALALAGALSSRYDFVEIEVPQQAPLTTAGGVLGLDANTAMLRQMRALLEEKQPTSTFMIGGTCATEIAPVSYLNQQLNGDLCVLWFDAHGDLNTPQSSPSGHLHGMPLRTLLGDGHPDILAEAFSVITPKQTILVGARELDPPEQAFIAAQNITVFPPATLSDPDNLVSEIESRGYHNVYLHLDLDILDPAGFPHLLVPTPGGITTTVLTRLLEAVAKAFHVAGFSVVEYVPKDHGDSAGVSNIIEACLGT